MTDLQTTTNSQLFIADAVSRLIPELRDSAHELVNASEEDLAGKRPASGLGWDVSFLDPDLVEVFRRLKPLLQLLIDLGIISFLQSQWQGRKKRAEQEQIVDMLKRFEEQQAAAAEALRDIADAVAAFDRSRGSSSSADAIQNDVRSSVAEAAIASSDQP